MKNKKLFLIFALIFSMIFTLNFASAVSITTCQTLSTAGTTYVLQNDILNIASTCFDITADNIILDGNGFTIDGTDTTSTFGVYATGRTNLTIKNFKNIINFSEGIYFTSTNNSLITNNTVNLNRYGIYLEGIYLQSSSNNNTITNNTANSNSQYGINIAYTQNNTIINNTANSNNRFGIILSSSPNSIITNNTANSNKYGIYFSSTNNSLITNNTANSNTLYGIYLSQSSNNTLNNNSMVNNSYNFAIDGNVMSDYSQNISTSNTVDGKPIYYLVGKSNQVIDQSTNAGFVGLISSDNITVKNLNLTKNEYGVLLVNTNNSLITNNTANSNNIGILLKSSSNNNTITNNTANSNSQYGINLEGIYLQSSSNNNTITNNTANSNSQYGIHLYFYSNNTITNNTVNSNQYGIILQSSLNNTLTNNTANSNQYGIYLQSSSNNNQITNNTANSNQYGIILQSSSNNNTITNNTANSNTLYGIRIQSSSNNNQFINNKITNSTTQDISDTTGDLYINYLIYNNSFGEIKWNNETNSSFLKNLTSIGDIGLNTNLSIGNNTAYLNAGAFTQGKINSSANITLYGIDSFGFGKNLKILRDGLDCGSDCYNFTPLNISTVKFNVTYAGANYSIYGEEIIKPNVNLLYPTNTTYNSVQTQLNYSASDTNLNSCWYSTDSGATNTSIACGTNVTGLSSIEGLNTWTIYANDTVGNENSSSISFTQDTTPPNINFVSPTSTNASTQSSTNVEINTSITNATDLNEVKYNWNGANYTIMNNSLVLMMNFDNVSALGENDTHVVDVSGNGNNGTVVGGNTTIANGKYQRAMQFDGVDDYVESSTGAISAVNGTNFTILFWFKNKEVSSSSFKGTFSFGYGSQAGHDWGLQTNTNPDRWRINFRNTTDFSGDKYIDVTDNNWHQYGVTFVAGSGDYFLYRDGIVNSQGISSVKKVLTNSDIIRIGTRDAGSQTYINGSIDEVRIYNRSLSASEIQQLYFSNLNKYDTDKWNLYVNQSKNSTTGLDTGTYTYQTFAKDTSGNLNQTEQRTITVDTTPPTYSNSGINTTSVNALAKFSILYNDNIALNPNGQYTFSTNNSGTWVNDSTVNFTATPSWANSTKTLNSTGNMVVGYRWYATDNLGNSNDTEIFTLTLVQKPIIKNNYTFPTYPKKDDNVVFYANVSDNDILSVNFTLFAPNGTFVINQLNGTNNGNGNWTTTYNLNSYGTWTWNVTAYDNSGFNASSSNISIILMQITETLNSSIVFTNKSVLVSGYINLSDGTNVTNTAINIYLNGTLLTGGSNGNFTDKNNTDFNAGTFYNTTIEGTGDSANVTLNRTSFLPSDVGNLYTWYRSDQGVTISTGVSQWNDLSGNGKNLTQGTGANQPTVITGDFNGYDSISFDGIDDGLTNTAYSISQPFYVFAVMQQDTWTSNDEIMNFNAVDLEIVQPHVLNGGGVSPQIGQRATETWGNKISPALGSPFLLISSFNGASAYQAYNNNVNSGGLDTLTTTAARINVASKDELSQFGNIRIAEIAIYSAEITGTDLTNLKNYFNNRYNLWGNSVVYEITGNFTSQSFDSGDANAKWTTISWNNETPANTALNISTRTSNDNSTWSEWSSAYINNLGSTISQNSTARYLQYRAKLNTTNNSLTPKLLDLTINYSASTLTDSLGNYNYTFTALSETGTYPVKVNTTYGNYIGKNTVYLTIQSSGCSCPSSGDWVINSNTQCTLTTSCDVGVNKFQLMNGSLKISNGVVLKANGCFIKNNQNFFIEDGGGLLCV